MRWVYLLILSIVSIAIIWIFVKSNFSAWYLVLIILLLAFLHAFLFNTEYRK